MKSHNFNFDDRSEVSKTESGYTVPAGYFETFGERLSRRIAEEKKPVRPRGIIYFLRPAVAVAAGFTLLMMVYFHYPVKISDSQVASLGVNDSIASMNSVDLLVTSLDAYDNDSQFIAAFSELNADESTTLTKDGIVDYLASNCSDYEIITANK